MIHKGTHQSLAAIILISIVVISAAMHARHFNKELMGLHVWRQTETQSTINNFHEEDMNILNPRRNNRGAGEGLYRREFPLMQWFVAASYSVTGQHLIVTRIWMFVIGIFSVVGMYRLIKALSGKKMIGLLGAWALCFSPSFYYYTINPMPDNLALCFGIWGLTCFFTWTRHRHWWHLLASGILLSLSALCKLPFLLYFSVPAVYLGLEQMRKSGTSNHGEGRRVTKTIRLLAGVCFFIVFPVAWYVAVIPGWHQNGIVQGMLANSASFEVLRGNFFHHLLITLPELLLNYGSVPLFLAGLYFLLKKSQLDSIPFVAFAVLGLLLVLFVLFELNMIGKSHDYYFFPFLPLLFIVVSFGASRLIDMEKKWVMASIIVLLLVMPLAAYFRIDNRWNPEKPGFNRDLLAYKDELRQAVPRDALCITGNDLSYFIYLYYIDKKGWTFHYDELDDRQVSEMIKQGAHYMYSDSRKVEQQAGMHRLLDTLVMQRGSVKIFRLISKEDLPSDF